MHRRDTQLQSEIMSLKSREKEQAQKVHQLEKEKLSASARVTGLSAVTENHGALHTSKPPSQMPVPKPRTNVLSLAPLQQQIERLEEEKKGLRSKFEKEEGVRKTVEDSYQKQTSDHQKLTAKHSQLEKELDTIRVSHAQLQSEMDSLQPGEGVGSRSSSEVQQLTDQLSSLKLSESKMARDLEQRESRIIVLLSESEELQTKLTTVETQKQDEVAAVEREKLKEVSALRRAKIDCDQKISTLEEKLSNLPSSTTESLSASGRGQSTQIRLNSEIGKRKELEQVCVCVTCAHHIRYYDAFV